MRILLLITCVLFVDTVAAQDQAEPDQDPQRIEENYNRPIEEIVVISSSTFPSLRFQIREMKDAIFAAFNELNDDDDFDVNCASVGHTRSRIKKHVCRPVFFDKAISENAQAALGNWIPTAPAPTDFLQSQAQIKSQQQRNFEKLQKLLLELAEEDEAFAASLIELGERELEFAYRKEVCMEKPAVLFLFRKC